jgi:hypothetical protein
LICHDYWEVIVCNRCVSGGNWFTSEQSYKNAFSLSPAPLSNHKVDSTYTAGLPDRTRLFGCFLCTDTITQDVTTLLHLWIQMPGKQSLPYSDLQVCCSLQKSKFDFSKSTTVYSCYMAMCFTPEMNDTLQYTWRTKGTIVPR